MEDFSKKDYRRVKADLELEMKANIEKITNDILGSKRLSQRERGESCASESTDSNNEDPVDELLNQVKQEPVEKPCLDELQKLVVRIPKMRKTTSQKKHDCENCKQTFRSITTLQAHLKKHHAVPLSDILPDLDDPKNFCKVCEKTFSSTNFFRRHLRVKHGMTAAIAVRNNTISSRRLKAPEPQFVPELTYYCRLCQKSLVNKRRYLGHIRRVHNVVEGFDDEGMDDEDTVPQTEKMWLICDTSFPESSSYNEHMETTHSGEPSNSQPPAEEITTNGLKATKKRAFVGMYDTSVLTIRCRYCSEEGLTQDAYRDHLKEAHDDRLQPLLSKIVQPNASDKKPEVFCDTCDIKMEVLGDCVKHLRQKHDLKVHPDPKLIIERAAANHQQSGLPLYTASSTGDFTSLLQFLYEQTDEG